MSNEFSPDAQGPQGGTDFPQGQQDQGNPQQAPGEGQHTGFQARISQLTAKMREFERQAQLERERNQQLQQELLLRALNQQPQQQPQDPYAHLPEEEREVARRYTAPLEQRFEARLNSIAQQNAQMVARLEMQNALQGHPPEVAQRASQLYQAWQQRGATGWRPEDAVTFAYGELGIQRKQTAQQAGQQLDAFNGGYQPVTQHAPPPQPRQNPAQAPIPPDIDSWDPEKQAEFWEKRLGNNTF